MRANWLALYNRVYMGRYANFCRHTREGRRWPRIKDRNGFCM